MSHFVVLVRLPANIEEKNLEAELRKRLIPYKEIGCGERDDMDEMAPYIEFKDVEEESRKEWETETTSMVKLACGTLASRWDEQFKNPHRVSLFSREDEWVYPEGCVKLDVPKKEVYPDFEEYMRDYEGRERNSDGKYGYYHNPNDKWDWYQIGGRWPEYLPTENGKEAVCLLSEIDHAWIKAEQGRKFEQFIANYEAFLNGSKCWGVFEGPREEALDLGLISCKNFEEITDDERAHCVLIRWERSTGTGRFDVCKRTSREELMKVYSFFRPVQGHARLADDTGWEERGEMGWFGADSSTSDTQQSYVEGTDEWFSKGNPQDWLIAVDCHI